MPSPKPYPINAFGISRIGVDNWYRNYSSPVCSADYQRIFDATLDSFTGAFPEDLKSPAYQTIICNHNFVSHMSHQIFFMHRLNRLREEGYTSIMDKTEKSLEEYQAELGNSLLADPYAFNNNLKEKIRNLWRNIRLNRKHAPLLHLLNPALAKSQPYTLGGMQASIVKAFCESQGVVPFTIQGRQFMYDQKNKDYIKHECLVDKFVSSFLSALKRNIPEAFDVFTENMEYKIRSHFRKTLNAYLNCRDKFAGWPDNVLMIDCINNLYHRIVGSSWKSLGRKTIGFTHGNAYATVYKPTVPRRGDLSILSEFIVSSEGEKHLLEDGLRDFSSSGIKSSFEIRTCGKNIYRQTYEANRNRPKVKVIKSVMLLGFPMSYHYHAYHPEQNSMPHIHLELTLIDVLKKNGYIVIYKAHPDTLEATRGIYDNKVDSIVTEPFEQVYNQADCILFGTPATTTFGFSLLTNIPIVCINTKGNYWHPELFEKLLKRSSMVDAVPDGRGRIVFKEQDLLQALTDAPGRMDFQVVEDFAMN
jgi:hypothetical protein